MAYVRWAFGLAIVPIVFLVGCSGTGGSGTIVTGKVTYKGDPVSAEMAFFDANNKQARTAPIMPDGTYTVADLPVGEYKVTLNAMKSIGGVGPAPDKAPAPGDKGGLEGPIKGVGGAALGKGVAPPPKYSSPDSGLKLTVKAGKQTQDFPLE
jgi:hypothetical protein